MVSIRSESNGVSKTIVACSRAEPKIACFLLSKVESPRRGARYERHDNAYAFPCCLPGRYVILKSKRVRNWAHRACRLFNTRAF